MCRRESHLLLACVESTTQISGMFVVILCYVISIVVMLLVALINGMCIECITLISSMCEEGNHHDWWHVWKKSL